MPLAAFAIFFCLSVESWKASSRAYNRRKSRKHGYGDLPTDAYGRPINERGEVLSRNEARALVAHQRELERIKTAEREWRLEGEKLPNYEEARSASIREALRRPNTAHPGTHTRSVNRSVAGSRATSWGGSPTPAALLAGGGGGTTVAGDGAGAAVGSAIAFSIRRNGPNLAMIPSRDSSVSGPGLGPAANAGGVRATARPGLSASMSAPLVLEDMVLDDVIRNDGMDWQRATWEGSPIYAEVDRAPPPVSVSLPSVVAAAAVMVSSGGGGGGGTNTIVTAPRSSSTIAPVIANHPETTGALLDRQPSRLVV